jgi:hypothetical protein
MDVNKYICTYNPGYKSRNYDENNFHFIIKHNQEIASKTRTSLDQQNFGTVYPSR